MATTGTAVLTRVVRIEREGLHAVSDSLDTHTHPRCASRRRVFDTAATDRLLVTGMHFPGFAHLVRSGTGYRLIPAAWKQAR